ncbi:MAG: NifB/NifX family molybdenum-iron cluster-binding protein [Anaerolineales bacterium]
MERRFGRAPYFVEVDTGDDRWMALPNPALDALGGAGTMAAEHLSDRGVQVVISGDFGPNAARALMAGNIKMYTASSGTPRQLVEAFLAGELEELAFKPGGRRRGSAGAKQGGRGR